MSILELILISIGLSMDSFAVAICKGLSMKKMNYKKACIIGLYFGGFQALMPVIGYLLGKNFQDKIVFIDHWMAFVLLSIIGFNMVKEALSKDDDEENKNDSVDFKTMIGLAIATSIDALAVGVTLAFLKVNLLLSSSFIGLIAFLISFVGVKIGNVFGDKYEKKAELVGGLILILIGVKILVEHLFFK